MAKDKTTNPVEDAKKLLMEDQKKREIACMNEIQAVLDKYGFGIGVTQPQVTLVLKG